MHSIDPNIPLFNVQSVQAIGGVGAMFATRFIQSWLFEIGRGGPATDASVAAGLVCIALIASSFPGRRAAMIDPLVSMRAD